MTIPHALFGGLALIALSIYFSVGSLPVSASIKLQKVMIFGYAEREEYIKPDDKINCARVSNYGIFRMNTN